MTRTVIIGGSGHVGTFLVPMLIEAGHEVINVTRGASKPYLLNAAWDKVRQVEIDRAASEQKGEFGEAVAELRPDNVIDMICFDRDSASHLVDALKGRISHLIHIGTIWVHGVPTSAPTKESDAREPFGDYGVQKSEIEDYLLQISRRGDLACTIVRPGHIVGPHWAPLNPAGHFDLAAFKTIKAGEKLLLPNFGLEMVHHVHAQDVAQMCMRSLNNWSRAAGEAFNAVSPAAVTLRGYAEAMYRHWGNEPNLEFLPFEEWAKHQTKENAEATWEHIARSPCHSIEKAQTLLGYAPRYSSMAAVQESVATLLP